MQTLMVFRDCNSVSAKLQHLRCLWMQIAPRTTQTSERRCHNCNCGMRAVDKLTLYRTLNGAVSNKDRLSTSAMNGVHAIMRGVHVCFQTVVPYNLWNRMYVSHVLIIGYCVQFDGFMYLWTSPDVFCIKFSCNICNEVSLYGEFVSEFGCTLYNFNYALNVHCWLWSNYIRGTEFRAVMKCGKWLLLWRYSLSPHSLPYEFPLSSLYSFRISHNTTRPTGIFPASGNIFGWRNEQLASCIAMGYVTVYRLKISHMSMNTVT